MDNYDFEEIYDDDLEIISEGEEDEENSEKDDELTTEYDDNLECLQFTEDVIDEDASLFVNKEDEKKLKKKYIGVPFLTKFEKTRVLGIRTQQIIAGSKIFVDTKETDPYKIAIEELQSKNMPLIIRRYFAGNKFKDISVNSLDLLN